MAINTCTITGNVKNLLGSNVVGATIRVSTLAPFIHSSGPAFIAGEISSVTTDASGNFSVAVIETETPGVKLNFTLEYYDGVSAKKQKSYAVVVPNTATAELSSLISATAAVAGVTTFPGSSVTIVPSGNLSSSDAQDALYELQSDVDALNALPSGKIYLGNSLGAAAEVTPTGDVTIDNTGVTAITAGSIVNTDINASAAIAYSKLALTGSIVNADIGASAAIAYSKLALAGSIVNADIASGAAVDYSKLNLAGSIVNADISASAAIAYSKLALTGSIVNADINASAAIARSKIAAGTAYGAVVNDSSGALTSVAPSTSGNVLTSDGTQWTSATPASSPTQPYETSNLGLATSVASNAMTVALKQSDGSTNPSSGAAAVKIGFRSSTVTSGAYNQRSVTAALSMTISSGATLGQLNAGTAYIWVYALDNAGTVELAVSSKLFDDGSVQSTTAMSGSATSGTALYSTTARTSVAIRVIGRIKNTQTTAGTYASNAVEVSLIHTTRPRNLPTIQTLTSGSGATYTTPAGVTSLRVRMVGGGGGGSGGGSTGATGSVGSNTTFGTGTAGGATQAASSQAGGVGGTVTMGTGWLGVAALQGGYGAGAGQSTAAGAYSAGGNGGFSPLGGAGRGGVPGGSGDAAVANTGSGGGGGGQGGTPSTTGNSGGGGGSGGYLEAFIPNPAATYTYTIGAGGGGGSGMAACGAGGAGGSGVIIVEEYYN
jgi:hypothetical protein